jgi:hypothetical protein
MLIGIGIVMLVSFAAVAYLIYTAPLGYEDETGFHYGKEDDHSH